YALIVVGFIRCLGGCPQAPTAGQALPVIEPVTLFLILKTFAAGTTALTGIEAIADSVPAFRFPQSRNAAFTLAVLGAIAISMLVGVAWLAHGTGVVYNPDSPYTVIAQIGIAVFDKGIMFYVIQVTTAAILILAANTAFNGFPVLMYILARDRIMPRFFLNRGDRLALSNGILILAFFAGLVVYVFQASLNHLLQLYLIGVFVSFTLAQGGTALRWSRLKPPGWQRRAAINWFGAVMTGIVLGIVLVTKFLSGAWIVVALIPVLVYLMKGINRHLEDLKKELTAPSRRTQGRRRHQHVVLLVTRVDAATARAIGYVRGMRPDSATAVTFEAFNCPVWRRLVPYYPIQVLARREGMVTDLRRYLHVMRGRLAEDDFLTVVVPETLHSRALTDVVRSPTLQAVKAALLYEPGIQVLDIPIVAGDIDPDVDEARETVRNDVVVLAAGVNNATLQALKYAETLHPTSIRAVNFGLIPEESEKLVEDWLAEDIPYPLEIDDSPFRDIGRSLTAYVREMHPDGVRRIVTVILPEFVVPTRRHQLLHGQTGLVAKRYLLFERGVVVVSVPYHIHPERVREEARR
ncbi:MAG TPA: APC family permease, partial [Actinomycetota bacterium]|nr:APC family permease [Actinomycetota bacterium]